METKKLEIQFLIYIDKKNMLKDFFNLGVNSQDRHHVIFFMENAFLINRLSQNEN